MRNAAPSFAGTADAHARLAPERAAALLAELRQAHHDLLGAIDTLEELTSRLEPDTSLYPGARWRLSLASRKRRQLVAAASTALLRAAPPDETGAVEQLQREQAERLRESAAHVHAWPPARIAADWPGYCAASATIRASMRTRIAAERAALYPPLESYSRGG